MADADISEDRVRGIPGNASLEVKERVLRWLYGLGSRGFGTETTHRLNLVEVSIIPSANEPAKDEARVVLETTVTEDMMNPGGNLHGGCIAHMVDLCTTLPIVAISLAKGGQGLAGVSQSIHVVYHAPASLGDRLRLVNTSTAVGRRLWSSRGEIWDSTHHRLVASATQVKMEGSTVPKL